MVLALCGCVTTQELPSSRAEQSFRLGKDLLVQGKTDEGILQLEKAYNEQPTNLEYHTYLVKHQEIRISQLLLDADNKRLQGRLDEAQDGYQRILQLSIQNSRAEEGLAQIEVLRRHEKQVAEANLFFAADELDLAASKLREVLAEDANYKGARSLYETIEQKRNQDATANSRLGKGLKKTLSLEFKDAPLKTVFELFSKISNINFTFDRSVKTDSKVSIFTRDTTIEKAMEMLLTSNSLGKKVINENTILVYPDNKKKEYQDQEVRSFYLANSDAKRVMMLIKTIAKSKDVYMDEKLNMVVVRDNPDTIRLVEKLVASQDLAEPEVMLEVQVLEVNRRQLEAIGIKYPTSVAVGVAGNAASGGAPVAGRLRISELKSFNSNLGVFSISDPVLALNLLQQDTDTNLLANPHIRVKSKEKAKVHIGDKIPIITTTANSTGFVSETVTFLDVGIKLDVEPTVTLNDEVSIKVGLEVSNQTDVVRTNSGTLTYTIGTRNANTVLRLKNGETQVLAGLFKDDAQTTVNKVPGLSSLPLIGGLFKDRSKDRRKNEIVLLITPRIVRNIVPPESVYTSFPVGPDPDQGMQAVNATRAPMPEAPQAPAATQGAFQPFGTIVNPPSNNAPSASPNPPGVVAPQ